MQSKTSFFNKTVLRKDITRFAPVWGAYALGLVAVMVLFVINGGEDRNYWPVSHMMEMCTLMSTVNCIYAMVIAQLLFGDLYNTRSCYGLHAMPLRREAWFVTHIVSGLLFSLVPTALMTLAALPVAMASIVVGGWQVPLALFVTSNIQYLLFFGLAVFSTFCAGNRVGMVGIYGGLNIVVPLFGAAMGEIIESVLLGVNFPMEGFWNFCPAVGFGDRYLFNVTDNFYRLKEDLRKGLLSNFEIRFTYRTEHFAYYGICALVGIGLILAALWLYKKRNLECAGDLMAFRKLEPVFAVAAALCAGMVARMMYTSMSNVETDYYVVLAIGLILGWFVAKMLLERSIRVFSKKNFKGVAILAAVVAVCIGIIHWDPMGVENWVPTAEELESATFGRFSYGYEVQTQEDMDKLLRLHELALEQHLDGDFSSGYRREDFTPNGVKEDAQWGVNFAVSYVKKNGQKAVRDYVVWAETEAGELVTHFLSKPEIAMDRRVSNKEQPASAYKTIYFQGELLPEKYATPDQIQELFDAIRADCEEGHMAQLDALHNGYFQWTDVEQGWRGEELKTYERKCSSLYLTVQGGPESDAYFGIDLYMDSKHTLNWLESRGLLEELGITMVETDRPYDSLRERATAEQK